MISFLGTKWLFKWRLVCLLLFSSFCPMFWLNITWFHPFYVSMGKYTTALACKAVILSCYKSCFGKKCKIGNWFISILNQQLSPFLGTRWFFSIFDEILSIEWRPFETGIWRNGHGMFQTYIAAHSSDIRYVVLLASLVLSTFVSSQQLATRCSEKKKSETCRGMG